MSSPSKRLAGFYGIIVFKLSKGLLMLSLALGAYCLAGEDLHAALDQLLRTVHLDPESVFFSHLAAKLTRVTPANVYWLSVGTFIYSLFSLIEGTGLFFRISWAGWLAIGESVFFIPIEVFELSHAFTIIVGCILVINLFICYYLFHNRKRLFSHHASHAPPAVTSAKAVPCVR
jgi:uncharacterized membrane protein (DUF2068 family)